MWTNLIDNALDAMGGEGVLTLRTGRDGDCVVVEIADTGPGIPEEVRPRIFEPFFTTKPVGAGHRARAGRLVPDRGQQAPRRHPGGVRAGRHPFRVLLPLTEDAPH